MAERVNSLCKLSDIPKAVKEFFENCPSQVKKKLDYYLGHIRKNPAGALFSGHPLQNKTEPLKGRFKGCFRLKIDKWRVIYKTKPCTITILNADDRKDIYR
jgi:mRNA-degrading endonuclease RelE of RelBE toxin-antitoxin system